MSYKHRKVVAAPLRLIYTSSTEAEAEQRLVDVDIPALQMAIYGIHLQINLHGSCTYL